MLRDIRQTAMKQEQEFMGYFKEILVNLFRSLYVPQFSFYIFRTPSYACFKGNLFPRTLLLFCWCPLALFRCKPEKRRISWQSPCCSTSTSQVCINPTTSSPVVFPFYTILFLTILFSPLLITICLRAIRGGEGCGGDPGERGRCHFKYQNTSLFALFPYVHIDFMKTAKFAIEKIGIS